MGTRVCHQCVQELSTAEHSCASIRTLQIKRSWQIFPENFLFYMFSELISDRQLIHPAAARAMESENTEDDNKLFNSSIDGDLEGVVDALAQGGRVAMRNP